MDVIGIGAPAVDYIMEVNHLPHTDEFIDVKNYSCQGGGRVPTALAALGRLGSDCALVGAVGDDLFGRFCLNDLRAYGVSTDYMIVEKGAVTNFCLALAEKDTGGRSFLRQHGNCRPLSLTDLNEDAIRSAKVLHLSAMSPLCGKVAALW